jgi:hypothetical protein
MKKKPRVFAIGLPEKEPFSGFLANAEFYF